MAKKLINLLIEVQPDSPGIRRLKKIAPITSIFVLAVFIVFYVLSLVYVQINIRNYNQIKSQADLLEKKIASLKSSESLYITTIGVLDKIKNILSKDTKIIANTMPALFKIQGDNSVITTSSIDNSGPVGFTVKAESLNALENFINELKKSENENNFKEIKATGILRESDGSYTFTINLNAGK